MKLQLEQQRTELQYYKKLCLEEQTGREERIRVLNRDVQQRLVSARVELIALFGVLRTIRELFTISRYTRTRMCWPLLLLNIYLTTISMYSVRVYM